MANKNTPKAKYLPTRIGLGKDGKGKLHILIGSRRIEGFTGEVLDRGERF